MKKEKRREEMHIIISDAREEKRERAVEP